ncbi:lytic transglycosylase domain-containing protein [Microbacterium sp.]|uniref:aggregation-promoting factor C-terminal-like domain-containing protein n=1 Tax=Microbacterium sp. TaxID=51671 RepID=UPI0025D65676|nr:lytic transglycosylase domain-containing protein [Microbacterium sp.]
MRFSLHPARSPFTAAAVAIALLSGGGASAAFAADGDRDRTTSTHSVDAAGSDSRGASVADPLAHIEADAEAALAGARSAIAFAGDTEKAVADSGLEVEGTTAIDTSSLAAHVEKLSGYEVTPLMLLPKQVTEALRATDAVNGAAGELSGRLEKARAVKSAADAAAAQAAADRAAQVKAAEEAQAAAEAAEQAAAASSSSSVATVDVNVDPASAQGIGRSMAAAQYGWGDDQFACLVSLWNRESGWSVTAYNASSGAYGIPQALPGSKMASAGADWQTNPATQIAWGLGYISGRYGTPCGAWGHSQSAGWY